MLQHKSFNKLNKSLQKGSLGHFVLLPNILL